MGEEFAKCLAGVRDVERHRGGWPPVVRIAQGGKRRGEYGVDCFGLAWGGARFQGGDGGGVVDCLDADLGIGVVGIGRGGGNFRDGFAGFHEGPSGGVREDVADGSEARFVMAFGVEGAPISARLPEENADAGLSLGVVCAGGRSFVDADDRGLSGGREGKEEKRDDECLRLHSGQLCRAGCGGLGDGLISG